MQVSQSENCKLRIVKLWDQKKNKIAKKKSEKVKMVKISSEVVENSREMRSRSGQ